MAINKTNIFVYAHWLGMTEPKLIGILSAQQGKGRKSFSFEYEKEWLKSNQSFLLDPDIQHYSGPQFPVSKENFGFFLDSMPDTWGRTLMKRRASALAKEQGKSPSNLYEIDFLLIDLPPGTGDIQLTLVQTIPLTGAVIVTTPQEVSLIDAKKGLKMFERVNVPVFGIIENMSYFIAPDTGTKYDIFGSGGGEKLAAELNSKLLGCIPIDPRIREGGDSGKPIVEALPDSENSKIIREIARNLAAQISIKNSNDQLSEVEIQL